MTTPRVVLKVGTDELVALAAHWKTFTDLLDGQPPNPMSADEARMFACVVAERYDEVREHLQTQERRGVGQIGQFLFEATGPVAVLDFQTRRPHPDTAPRPKLAPITVPLGGNLQFKAVTRPGMSVAVERLAAGC